MKREFTPAIRAAIARCRLALHPARPDPPEKEAEK